MNKLGFTLVLILAFHFSFSQVPVPGKRISKSILILNGKAHLGTGEAIEKSAIVIKEGKIVLVKNALMITIKEDDYDSIIDATGKHIYPGFIAPNSTLGLQEIGAVRASRDLDEVGAFNPHVRSLIAFNTDSKITPTVRTNGVLMGQITPRGGVISGTSSIVHFDGWNWEDAVIKTDDAVHLNWPKMTKRIGRKSKSGESNINENYSMEKKAILDFFLKSRAYSERKNNTEKDLHLEGMMGVFSGRKKVFVHVDMIKEINDMISFTKELKLQNVVIVGGYDAYLAAEELKINKIPVVLKRIHELPTYPDDDIDLPYKMPKLLNDAGVLFCLNNEGDMEQMGARNLPFYAGTSVAYGMLYEEAVASLTLNAAKILGIDNFVGSIEVGKQATLFISEGDALDMRTNNVSTALIQGRFISLDNHQNQLYNKYKTKYDLK